MSEPRKCKCGRDYHTEGYKNEPYTPQDTGVPYLDCENKCGWNMFYHAGFHKVVGGQIKTWCRDCVRAGLNKD